jgi:hypothetical protein
MVCWDLEGGKDVRDVVGLIVFFSVIVNRIIELT